ncbi:hypothetical protein AQUCO_01400229v1 [Aquilegia coerulea]|uniref:Protein FAR1-RELATED SEQUENCE n=1 Tax=Aquilegia coerulea TaxID=218851 RepID=A0A2G5DV98_AQUCA|nr:hypothetical protein AQUCO_01400229v1 [Aquilegia coerulea]
MNSFGFCLQSSEQTNQLIEIHSEMHNSTDQRSPSYHAFYTPSSPPWSSFPIVSPITHSVPTSASFTSAEVSSSLNAAAGESSSVPSSDLFHLLPESETVGSVATCLPMQSTVATSPCDHPQPWDMEESQQCICLEDTIGLGREMLEPDVVFDESIHDPEHLHLQESPRRDGNVAETSGRDECNALLIKFGSEPYIGLEFRSEGEAYEYYRAYAKENGFSIRKSHVERSRVDHSLISRKFVCVKQGFRSLKDKRYEGKIVRHRRVTRVDCRAAMIIKRRSGKWVVHRFHKEHNHGLGEPANSSELQSDQKMTNATKSILEALYKTQCIDIEDNISHGQKTVEDNVEVFDLNARELQRTTYVKESPNEDVKMADSSGREGNYAKGSLTTEESNERGDNDASLMKLGSEPYLGLQFGSQDEAYEFYNAYAKEKGFSIRKSRIERSRIDHSMISRLYVCANQGLRSTKDKRYEGKIVRPRQETRLDCRAAMFIKRRSGIWVVERFHKEHNHDLVDPTKAEKLRSHRKMTMATKSMLEELYKCGVGPSKIVDLLTGVADGAKDILENNGAHNILGHNEEDSETYMKKERKNNIRIECYSLLDYFQELQAADPGFFYAVEFGENRCMRSIFWADSNAREAYKQFGDVLVFDTTCRTNKFLFPFACLTGVNHHRQSVLFGCGFLADETVESFVWLFETWLRAMSNRQPTSIITNQDKATKAAIEKVFPDSGHRFCMWHIEKDELENLTHVFDMHTDFRAEYKSCIYNSYTPTEFELGWEALLLKYNLKDNKWLSKLFNQRHYWVPLYLRHTFFGGMATMHKEEGINSYFDGLLHGGASFNEFVPQYEQVIKQHRKQEVDGDFLTVFTRAVLTSKNPIEEQAAKIYTRNMFTKFQHEFIESSGCTAQKIGDEGSISKYMVGKYRHKDEKMHIVAFDPTENSASCSCQMFDSEGMLCRHVLKVFQVVNVFEIPPRYILKRWTMNGRYGEFSTDEAGDGYEDPNRVNIWTLKEKTKAFVELGEISRGSINVAKGILQEAMRKLSIISVPTVSVQPDNLRCNSNQGVNIDEQGESVWAMDLNITVPDVHRIKSKGRPVSSRIKLGIEQAQKKKKRTCGTCKETGHYTRTCPKGTVDQSPASELRQGPIDQSQTSAMFQGTVDLPHTSRQLQRPVDHLESSAILHSSFDQSQTSMMLQEHYGQPQIFDML